MSLEEQLAAWIQGNVVIVGVGNPLRGGDAAGSLVSRQIAASRAVSVIDAQDVPENYVAAVVNCRPDTIVLIDSVDLGSEPGSVALLDRNQIAGYWPSTHRVPLSLLMSVFERETHARVFVIAIQPGHTEFLQAMNDAAGASVAQVAGVLNRALAAAGSLREEVSA